jgi:transposase-like protein
MTKRKRYTDKFRAGAIVMLEANGYPDKKGALATVSNHLGVPQATLHRWFHAKNNPAPSEIVTEQRIDFAAALRKEIAAALQDMPNARQDATYRDLVTGTAIMIDKLQLLEGKPTEHIAHDHSGNLTIEDRASRITEILNTARNRRTGSPASDTSTANSIH